MTLQARACIDLCIVETYSNSCLKYLAPCRPWLAETCQLAALPVPFVLCDREPRRLFLPQDTSVFNRSPNQLDGVPAS